MVPPGELQVLPDVHPGVVLVRQNLQFHRKKVREIILTKRVTYRSAECPVAEPSHHDEGVPGLVVGGPVDCPGQLRPLPPLPSERVEDLHGAKRHRVLVAAAGHHDVHAAVLFGSKVINKKTQREAKCLVLSRPRGRPRRPGTPSPRPCSASPSTLR